MSNESGKMVSLRYPKLYLDEIWAETPEAIESERSECRFKIGEIREQMAMLIAGNPKDLMTSYDVEEHGSVQDWISEKIDMFEIAIGEQHRKIERLDILDNILYEWEHGNVDAHESIYGDVAVGDTNWRKFVFPEDVHENEKEHIDVLLGRKPLDDNSLGEMYAKSVSNMDAEEYRRKQIENGVYAFVDGKLFVTYLGQWLFKNEEDAFTAIKSKLNISSIDYVNNNFVKSHKAFFEDVMKWANDEDAKVIQEYVTNIEDAKENYVVVTEFYEAMMRGINNYIKSHIEFRHIA